MPNIILLENQALVAKGLSLLIEGDPSNHIFSVVPDSQRLWRELEQKHPQVDLAILDIELDDPSETGLDLAEKIRGQYPLIKILFLTSYKRCEFILPVFGKYEGYLFKGVHPNDLRRAITDICTPGKGTYYDQEAVQFYYQCMQDKRPDLSQELIQIIKLIAKGWTNPEIAEQLSSRDNPLTENSIRERRRKLRVLLQAKNSPHVIARAFKYGFLTTTDIP